MPVCDVKKDPHDYQQTCCTTFTTFRTKCFTPEGRNHKLCSGYKYSKSLLLVYFSYYVRVPLMKGMFGANYRSFSICGGFYCINSTLNYRGRIV